MENYGFILITDEDAQSMDYLEALDYSKDLFNQMESESKRKGNKTTRPRYICHHKKNKYHL